MVPQSLNEKLFSAYPFLVSLKKNVADTLGAFADNRNFPISSRIKTSDSVVEKIEMGRLTSFSNIDDLVAFTLIIPTAAAAQENEVIDFCKSAFDIVSVRNKSTTQKSPDVFRFDATRIVSRVRRPPDLPNTKDQSIFHYLFELQVRTAFEHAWSVATHGLVYKSSIIDWKRERLAAQLKATAEGLDAAMAAFDQLALSIEASPWDRVLDRIDVSKYVTSAFEGGQLHDTLRPSSLVRFSDNFCRLARAIQPQLSVQDALHIIDHQIKQATSIPVSLSLYQLFLGLLCQTGHVTGVNNIHCHVTKELATLFPETAKIRPIFDYDS